jgi:hypothetical protein
VHSRPRLLDSSQLSAALLRDDVIDSVRRALLSVSSPRFFESERGYQGELLVQLARVLPDLQAPAAIVEQEYQKLLRLHGLRLRPDIIIHEPFDPTRHRSRLDGNVVVFELKRRAGPVDARAAFTSLATMLRVLSYPLAVFVNVDSSKTHITEAPAELRQRLVAFAVKLGTDGPTLHEGRA